MALATLHKVEWASFPLNPAGATYVREEPAVVAISTPSGKFVDASAMLEGQTLTKGQPACRFYARSLVGW